jgi:hypothetical protein
MEDPRKGFFETILNQKIWISYYFRKQKVQVVPQRKPSKGVGGIATSPILTLKGQLED